MSDHGKIDRLAVGIVAKKVSPGRSAANPIAATGWRVLLHFAMPTVAMHLVNARKKLAATTREQAVAKAVKRGFIEP